MARFSIELFENKRWFKSKFVEIFIALFVTLFVFSSLKVLMRYFREAPENYWENLNSSAGSKETARYLYEQTDSSAGYVLADYRMLVEVYLQSFVKITEREMESSLWRRPHVYEFHGWVPGYSMNTEELQSLENKILKEGKALYYTLWSPVTHQRRNPWEARFSRFYETFRQVHPQKNAEKIIYYPDGTPAVEIFKILPKIVEE